MAMDLFSRSLKAIHRGSYQASAMCLLTPSQSAFMVRLTNDNST